MKNIIITLLILCAAVSAQIPNSSFEQWDDDTSPTGWFTSNVLQVGLPISKSLESYSNSYALKGAVVETTIGDTLAPLIISGEFGSGFPVTNKYINLSLYYKFNSVGGDIMLVAVLMYKSAQLIGIGTKEISESAPNYTQAIVSIEYLDESIPDICLIEILAGSPIENRIGHPNTYFIVDELSFDGITSVDDGKNTQPANFRLEQNFPNPFNPSTKISFSLSNDSFTSLNIYNSLGEIAVTLVNEELKTGEHTVEWNAANFASGIYYYKIDSGTNSETKKMLLIK